MPIKKCSSGGKSGYKWGGILENVILEKVESLKLKSK